MDLDTTTIPYLINKFVNITYRLHRYFLSLNDNYEKQLTDKELHFLIVGLLGIVLMLIIGPIFRYLAKKHLTIIITWIFVFVILLGLTFALEIAQGYSGTGFMDFNDIVSGIKGYLFMSAILIGIYAIFKLIALIIKKIREKQ